MNGIAPAPQHPPDSMSGDAILLPVAVPEFDGRLITVPFSFRESGADGPGESVPTGRYRGRAA